MTQFESPPGGKGLSKIPLEAAQRFGAGRLAYSHPGASSITTSCAALLGPEVCFCFFKGNERCSVSLQGGFCCCFLRPSKNHRRPVGDSVINRGVPLAHLFDEYNLFLTRRSFPAQNHKITFCGRPNSFLCWLSSNILGWRLDFPAQSITVSLLVSAVDWKCACRLSANQ